MRKKTVKLLACAAVTAMMLSATACGSEEAAAETAEAVEETAAEAEAEEGAEAEAEDKAEAEAEVKAEVDKEAAEAEAAAEKAAEETEAEAEKAAEEAKAEEETASGEATTLEEYYNDATVKSIIDSAYESMSEEGMSVSLEVKENTMTVIIKLVDDTYMVDGIGDMLQTALEDEAQASQFEEQVAEFDEIIGESGACTVVMRYTDPDDNVLAEKAFTAK